MLRTDVASALLAEQLRQLLPPSLGAVKGRYELSQMYCLIVRLHDCCMRHVYMCIRSEKMFSIQTGGWTATSITTLAIRCNLRHAYYSMLSDVQ